MDASPIDDHAVMYLLTVLCLAILPLLAGWRLADQHRELAHPTRRTFFGATFLLLCWWLVAIVARHYGEIDAPGWAQAEWFAQRGKWYVFATAGLWVTGVALRQQHALNERRQIVLALVLEVMFVTVMIWKTAPVHVAIEHRNRRDELGHIRQSIEPTCGPVALANLLERYYGHTNVTERQMARLAHTTVEGSTVSDLRRAGQRRGLQVTHCRHLTLEELQQHGGPAIVSISTMPEVRHATLLCGFVSNRVAFIDPNYGYREISQDRFTRTWYGKALTFARATKGSVGSPEPR